MFRWLKSIFSSPDPFTSLPHYARVWLAVEAAALFTPIYRQQWAEAPERQTRRLCWSQNALRQHITGADERPRIVRLAVARAIVSASIMPAQATADALHVAAAAVAGAQYLLTLN